MGFIADVDRFVHSMWTGGYCYLKASMLHGNPSLQKQEVYQMWQSIGPICHRAILTGFMLLTLSFFVSNISFGMGWWPESRWTCEYHYPNRAGSVFYGYGWDSQEAATDALNSCKRSWVIPDTYCEESFTSRNLYCYSKAN
jgi:hypothetical protein